MGFHDVFANGTDFNASFVPSPTDHLLPRSSPLATGGVNRKNVSKKDAEAALRAFGLSDLSGQIDPIASNALSGALSRRFNQLRQIQGADFTRRGLRRSTIAAGALGRTTDLERRALTETFAAQQFARQSRGANILGGFQVQDLARSQGRAQTLGNIFELGVTLVTPLIEGFLQRRKASQPQQQGGIV